MNSDRLACPGGQRLVFVLYLLIEYSFILESNSSSVITMTTQYSYKIRTDIFRTL